MGGNIKIGEYQAEPLAIIDRSQTAFEIHNFLAALMDLFAIKTNKYIRINDSWYSGSTKHLMDANISNEAFTRYKPYIGDIDVQFPLHLREEFENFMCDGRCVYLYVVRGMKRHGNETSFLLGHNFDKYVIQFDFEFVENPGSEEAQFLHSADWGDIMLGIKGVHHKLLLNAIGGDTYRFSITHGLRRRDSDELLDRGKDPWGVGYYLFGNSNNTYELEMMKSFSGLVSLLYLKKRKEQYQPIIEKFEKSCSEIWDKTIDSTEAIKLLKNFSYYEY